MFKISMAAALGCVEKALDSNLAAHIVAKAIKNDGFGDNPKAIHPVTKLVTLGLDKNTRALVEAQLILESGLEERHAAAELNFIKACMMTVNENMVKAFVDDDHLSAEVWEELDTKCSRDGALFLQAVENMSPGPLREACEFFCVQA